MMKGDSVKKVKMTVLIASAFAVTMNLNGCVYGPPVDLGTTESKDVIETSVVDHSSSRDEEPHVYGPPLDSVEETHVAATQNTASESTATSDSQTDTSGFSGLITIE